MKNTSALFPLIGLGLGLAGCGADSTTLADQSQVGGTAAGGAIGQLAGGNASGGFPVGGGMGVGGLVGNGGLALGGAGVGGALGKGGSGVGGAVGNGGSGFGGLVSGGGSSVGGSGLGGALGNGGANLGGSGNGGGPVGAGGSEGESTCQSGVNSDDPCNPQVDDEPCVRSNRTCNCDAATSLWICTATEGAGGAEGTGGGAAAGGGESDGGASAGGVAETGGQAGQGTGGSVGEDGYPFGNEPVPSEGCGNGSPSLTNGKHNISSAGMDREYILSVPNNYDENKPYRLIFGMHCMGSSADGVVNENWYRLKPFDSEESTIWVAPQGYTDSMPWRGSDDKDHVLFEDLYELVRSEFCIDLSRVFSVGFSFGAMFSNALAQNHQNVLRGVVVYATADYNIYFPDNTGEPLAYMGVHGSGDGTCPFDSGQRSKDRFVDNNGCEKPGSVPEANSGTHVTYDYEGCGNFPVRWATHNGGHTDQPSDSGQSWAPTESWEFITQF